MFFFFKETVIFIKTHKYEFLRIEILTHITNVG